MNGIELFLNESSAPSDYWRAIILFGRNTATYKFALAEALLGMIESGSSRVTLEELAMPFSAHICEHLKHCDKQVTGKSSAFLDACRDFNNGKLGLAELVEITEEKGFNNVIDAFHFVDGRNVPVHFFETDVFGSKKDLYLPMSCIR